MAAAEKIASNATNARFAEEESPGVLPTSPAPVWYELEPNSYGKFGGDYTLLARNPINSGRQRKKGVITDLDATADMEQDFTQENFQNLLQGFFLADLRTKAELSCATVGSGSFTVASGGTAFKVNDIIVSKGFDAAANNGYHVVATSPAPTGTVITHTGSPAATVAATSQSGTISRGGHKFGAGDASINVAGQFPKLVTGSKDLTQLGLIPGEWIFIGGDAAINQFATCPSGFARVRSVAAHAMEFDKASFTFATDAGAGSPAKQIMIFFGRCLKNEAVAADQVERTYQLERTLGASDTASPSQIQSEYLVGAFPDEFTLNVNTADKVTAKLMFSGQTHETRSGVTGVKSGSRPSVVESDAFNTSSDIRRIKLALVDETDEAPDPLFAFVTDLEISIKNNVAQNKAVGRLGSIGATPGTFEVGGKLTAYFTDVASVESVINNEDVTLDFGIVKSNKGVYVDLPLIALGGGQIEVKQDEAIMVPFDIQAATAAKIDTDLNHTMLICFFDYLPDEAAELSV